MAKLKLDLDTLEVQSFVTERQAARAGTVRAFDDDDSGRTPSVSRQYTCDTFCPGPNSCADTCAYTCDTCGFTCAVDTCYDTCNTNVCACNLSDGGTCVC